MATFNMQGQNVINQNVAGRDINITQPGREEDALTTLENLKRLVDQAKRQGILNEEISTDADYQITKALQQAKKTKPDKKSILGHLDNTRKIVAGVTAASGLVTALVDATEAIRRIF